MPGYWWQCDRCGTTRTFKETAGSNSAIKTAMIAYAHERIAAGETVTGADLDRAFGTSNYGSRVLRHSGLRRR